MRTTPILLATLLLAAACQTDKAPVPAARTTASSTSIVATVPTIASGAAKPGPPKSAPWSADVEGRRFTLKKSRAKFNYRGDLSISLEAEHTTADGKTRTIDVGATLLPGPGGSFYAGRTIGVALGFSGEPKLKDSFSLRSGATRLSLQPFALKAGTRIRGTLEFDARSSRIQAGTTKYRYRAAGTFDIPLEGKIPSGGKYPSKLSNKWVQGTVAGKPFIGKSATALVFHGFGNDKEVKEITVWEEADVPCLSKKRRRGIEFDSRVSPGGLRANGDPHPVPYADVHHAEGKVQEVSLQLVNAWIEIDRVGARAGDRIVGRVYLKSRPFEDGKNDDVVEVSGRFDAKVCVVGNPGIRR